ncbi:hypothetical protein SKAU_G00043820 [Synaphobranchus kaupii]|uniref:Uncharacterized protein n=1 Tax=Synaphobranchus kaupii TaxID=118154 RepID=A0A9Q1J932_SYNKA|nr:hypothetical protein SKAU_G00043820 [Synaphobranchus kaupii]
MEVFISQIACHSAVLGGGPNDPFYACFSAFGHVRGALGKRAPTGDPAVKDRTRTADGIQGSRHETALLCILGEELVRVFCTASGSSNRRRITRQELLPGGGDVAGPREEEEGLRGRVESRGRNIATEMKTQTR